MRYLVFGWLVALLCSAMPVPHSAHAASARFECAAGAIKDSEVSGSSPIEAVPTYSYGDDGLVRFHFSLTSGGWLYTGRTATMAYGTYAAGCSFIRTISGPFTYSSALPDRHHIMAQAVPRGDDFYNFEVYDEDTGERIPNAFGNMPGNFPGDGAISIGFFVAGNFGSSDPSGSNVSGFSTPAVPVKIAPSAPVNTPVLIVPGVMGTEMLKGNTILWPDILRMVNPFNSDGFMDPLQFTDDLQPSDGEVQAGAVIQKLAPNVDYTKSLVEEFTARGYIEGHDLFNFPYDWRYGVDDSTVAELKSTIDLILQETGAESVDIVAHSTGGLIVKKYVESASTHHIRKAVFVGVPNLGAPKALKVLLQGDSFGVPGLSDGEMRKISRNMPVLYDLLPSPKYLAAKGSYVRVEDMFAGFHHSARDLDLQQTADYILDDHALNSLAFDRAVSLHTIPYDNLDLRQAGIDAYNIAGCRRGTIGTIAETRNHSILGTSYAFNAPRFVPGDGTVPFESATNMPVDSGHSYYALTGEHGKLLSQDEIPQMIVSLIATGIAEKGPHMTQDISECKLQGKAIAIYSPVAIEVSDRAGNRLGVAEDGSVENSIPDAALEIMGEHTFVFLSDDIQDYGIRLTGTGEGTATVHIDDIDGDTVRSMGSFTGFPVTPDWRGTLDFRSDPVLSEDRDNDGVFEIEREATPDTALVPPIRSCQ